MDIKDFIKDLMEKEELSTVHTSFGGEPLPKELLTKTGKAPRFSIPKIRNKIYEAVMKKEVDVFEEYFSLREKVKKEEFTYILDASLRFSFLIELTNLDISSTKMKTRWIKGLINKKDKNKGYEDVRVEFRPEEDKRASDFQNCYEIFVKCFRLLLESSEHLEIMKKLSIKSNRGFWGESVFTYESIQSANLHMPENIELAKLMDLHWLIKARRIMYPKLIKKVKVNGKDKEIDVATKIQTKTYQTDRSQTGEEQTNRAKRWECLPLDYQFASIADCWSVERKLLSKLTHFMNFPADAKKAMEKNEIFEESGSAKCPISFKKLNFDKLFEENEHGKSCYHVGHIAPLKGDLNTSLHIGNNIEWISEDGNRIQGSLSIEETRRMLVDIFEEMTQQGLIKKG